MQTVLGAIQAITAPVLNAISAFWQTHGERILALIKGVWEAIKIVVGTALRTVFDIIKLIMQLITGDWEGAWATIKGIIDRSIKANLAIIRTGLDMIRNIIGGFSLRDVGEALMNSLRDGILGVARAIADAAANVVRGAVDAAKRALGIRSPSKVFWEMGREMMRGLALGIEKAMELPVLETRLAVGHAAAAGGGTGIGGGLRPVAIHIHYQPSISLATKDEALDAFISAIEDTLPLLRRRGLL